MLFPAATLGESVVPVVQLVIKQNRGFLNTFDGTGKFTAGRNGPDRSAAVQPTLIRDYLDNFEMLRFEFSEAIEKEASLFFQIDLGSSGLMCHTGVPEERYSAESSSQFWTNNLQRESFGPPFELYEGNTIDRLFMIVVYSCCCV